MCMKWFEEHKNWSAIPIRLILGVFFIMAGFPKLTNLSGTSGFFDGLGIPLAGFFALVVGLVEFVGGIALILGLMTRYVAGLQAITMIVAILLVHLGGGYEKALLALMGALALLFSGAGKLSLDEKYNICK